jgi:hypothetical protein
LINRSPNYSIIQVFTKTKKFYCTTKKVVIEYSNKRVDKEELIMNVGIEVIWS